MAKPHIVVAKATPLGNLTSQFTVAYWAVVDAVGAEQNILSQSQVNNTAGWGTRIEVGGEPALITHGVKDYIFTEVLAINTLYHVAIVLDASFDAHLYINGQFKETVTHTVGATANTDDRWIVGAHEDSGSTIIDSFSGSLIDIKVWDRPHLAVDINNLYDDEKSGAWGLYRRRRLAPAPIGATY